MSAYRRYFVPGGTYFFTLVTQRRVPLFEHEWTCRLLGSIIRRALDHNPCTVLAIVLLPDHLHTLWALPPGDDRYARRWNWIKGEFTRRFRTLGGPESAQRESWLREGRRGVWQRRYWEHTIRDEADLERHFDYIHYNPVKHGYVRRPCDWRWSSFHRWVVHGHYDLPWGAAYHPCDLPGDAGEPMS